MDAEGCLGAPFINSTVLCTEVTPRQIATILKTVLVKWKNIGG